MRIRDDAAVVHKHVDVVLRRKEGADVPVQDEVGLDGAFDGFLDGGIRGVDQVADLPANGLLPGRKHFDVAVHARVFGVVHGCVRGLSGR
ncbi:hypothetical protein D3C86_1943620 [compost metagenome]